MQTLGHMHIIPLQSDNAAQIDSVLAQLGLNAIMHPLGDAHLLVVATDDSEEERSHLEQVQEVASHLDRTAE